MSGETAPQVERPEKLDDDIALANTVLIERLPIMGQEVLQLDIAMKDRSVMTRGRCFTLEAMRLRQVEESNCDR
jgi:hypothetical protein